MSRRAGLAAITVLLAVALAAPHSAAGAPGALKGTKKLRSDSCLVHFEFAAPEAFDGTRPVSIHAQDGTEWSESFGYAPHHQRFERLITGRKGERLVLFVGDPFRFVARSIHRNCSG